MIASSFYFPHMLSVMFLAAFVRLTRRKWTNLRLLFIHIPKTGGSTITQALRPVGLVEARTVTDLWRLAVNSNRAGPDILTVNHLEPEILVRVGLCTPRKLHDVAFAVMRNPYARTWSAYRHLIRVQGRRLEPNTEFDTFVDLVCGKKAWRTKYSKSFGLSHGAPQTQWISSNLWPGPARIFNLEHVAEIEEFLNDFSGKKITLHQANRGQFVPLPVSFPHKKDFESRFASDFQLGGYETKTIPAFSDGKP